MAARARSWATPEVIRNRVRRRWDDGTLLRAYSNAQVYPASADVRPDGAGEQFAPIEISLGGPKASELGERLGEVQAWIAALEAGSRDGSRYTLRYKDVGGQKFGRNRIPTHAVVSSFDQAWALLGVRPQVARFEQMLVAAADADASPEPAASAPVGSDAAISDGPAASPTPVRDWLIARPVPALDHAEAWPQILAAYRWLDAARGSGRYVRQIDVPGVDTKVIEAHRTVLAGLLGVSRQAGLFLHELGLRTKPEYVRFRVASGVAPVPVSELSVRVEELNDLDMSFATAVVVENEITYLTLPVPDGGIVIWGKGFDVARLGRWHALRESEVQYWGDLDTHGFAILHRLRTYLPLVRSFLMDLETLRTHRDRWGRESSPTSATLDQLTPEEAAVYDDLVSDRYGEQVRLEQERIDWAWAFERLPY